MADGKRSTFVKPRIGFFDVAAVVTFAYALLVTVRVTAEVAIPMWALPAAIAVTAAAHYIGAGLGTAARAKARISDE